jgi:putative cardiolipin synthase
MNMLHRLLRQHVFIALTVLVSGCATIDLDYPRTDSRAYTDTDDTQLGRAVSEHKSSQPEESGFFPLVDGIDALAARLLLADRAERSIDAQYFLIHDDLVGHAFLEALMRAADRGVRVRLLIDDIHTDGHDTGLAAIDVHPNMEIRLFNPFGHRKVRALDAFGGLRRMVRRMHNKSFTVDNQITIIGGRNIGDEYFDASEDVKFGDLDVAAVGPVVRDVSAMFDSYWNHKAAIPMPAISSTPDDPDAALRELREKVVRSITEVSESKYAKAIRSSILDRLQGNADAYTWAPYQLIYDSPDKSQPGGAATAASITDSLRKTVIDAQKELLVATAYFVLRDQEIDGFREYRQRGIDVSVLTNSLASNNHTISHSGYAPIRKPLLEAGIRLFELRADASIPGDKRVGIEDAKSTLHAKAFLVDRKRLFIGTFNWNQRSENIDTEMGVIIESEELAAEFAERFFATIEEQAYEVFLNEQGKLRWRGTEDGREVVLTKEPQTGFWRRFSAAFLRILPVKSQL